MSTRRGPGQLKQEAAVNPVSLIRKYKESDAWLWTEVAAVVIGLAFVIPTAIALWIDLQDRQMQRIAQAWQLLTQLAPGNSGKGPALEYLNSQGISLTGINLSTGDDQAGVFLFQVNLSGADLILANLSEADLREANLSRAEVMGADLSGAKLEKADLSGAILLDVDLSEAYLQGADLSEAYLVGANLSRAYLGSANLSRTYLDDADLTDAVGLTQSQLDIACGDDKTLLPDGLTIKVCAKQ